MASFQRAFRGSAEPQMVQLLDDIVLLEHSDPGATPVRLSTNTYAVLSGGRMLLFDVNNSDLVPLVDSLNAKGLAPAALMFSHRHSAGLGDAVETIANRFHIPVFLHPLDARHPQATGVGVHYQNPMGHSLLEEFDVEPLHFPGHTEGSVALYRAANGGTLLAGDAAMGPTAPQADAGVEYLIRPPACMNTNDALLRERWRDFHRPLASILPYHGTGYVSRTPDLPRIMQLLTRVEATQGLTG